MQLESLNFKLKIKMAYDGFDNINLLDAQAAVEAEMNLFENRSSGHTYTTLQCFTVQPNILQQQEQFQPNIQIRIQVSHFKT